ncbi:hypothetical protein KC865_00760 [Candidatus Kaiserbacteria bacterium]|nr:hypothetical protein [Candidatus Kaiserbacteria bacterium]
MVTFLGLVSIVQTLSIALGVGSSTLAVINFLVAIKDGKIDDTERRMMGVVYVVLRVAMVIILITTILLISAEYSSAGFAGLSAFSLGQLLTLFVLFTNAMLMTAHLMSTTFGPGLQAGSWYTLGILLALNTIGWTNFLFTTFILSYVTWLILAIGIVNLLMFYAKEKAKRGQVETDS